MNKHMFVEAVIENMPSQKGNALTTLNIKEKYISKDILKLTPFLIVISVCENLNKISKD